MLKRLFVLAVSLLTLTASVSAQYFCTDKGKTLVMKHVVYQDNDSVDFLMKHTVTDVQTDADGIITAYSMSRSLVNNIPFELDYICSYNPSTDETTAVLMTPNSFIKTICNSVFQSLAAQGYEINDSIAGEIEKGIKEAATITGELKAVLNPKAAPGTKTPNSSIKATVGMNTMSINFWDIEMLGFETVTVPAGTFECLKYKYTVYENSAQGKTKKYNTGWSALGIGDVKEISTDKDGKILAMDTLIDIK